MNRQKITSKVSRGILLSAVAVTAVLGASSCNKTEISVAKGDNIRFMVGLGGGENSTKTAYSDGNAADRSKAEDINWLSGDQIRIWSPECSEPTDGSYGAKDRCADYTVTPETGATTSGTIAVNPGTVGLRWGEPNVKHNFYAVYPSPNTTGKSDDSGTYGTASSFKFTGHIPAVQAISGNLTETGPDSDGKTTTVAAPDMNNLYMVAKSAAKPEDSGEGVFLDFVPLSTAIQFTIENAMIADDANMKINAVTLKSDPKSGTAKNLAGAFEVDMSGTWTKHDTNNNYPGCTEPAGGASQSTSLTIDFSQTTACTAGIAKGDRLQFTFFLLPTQSIDDLSFVITRKDGSGSNALKKRLEMANGTSVTFPVHKKTYVKGLLVPDGVQWVSFEYEIADWGNSEGGEIEMQNPD